MIYNVPHYSKDESLTMVERSNCVIQMPAVAVVQYVCFYTDDIKLSGVITIEKSVYVKETTL